MAASTKQQPLGMNVLALTLPPRARSCNPSPPWSDGCTKIVGQWACVRRSMASNSSRCSLPSPLAMSCNPSSPWADGCQKSLIDDTSAAASSQRNESQGGREHIRLCHQMTLPLPVILLSPFPSLLSVVGSIFKRYLFRGKPNENQNQLDKLERRRLWRLRWQFMKAFIKQSLPRGANGEDRGGVAAAATTGGTEGRCML